MQGSLTDAAQQLICNLTPHEGRGILRDFLGKTEQAEGLFPAHLLGLLFQEERFKVTLQKAVV